MEAGFDIIDKLTEEWKLSQPLVPEARKKLDKKFRLEFNYNSNHLEGSTLTYGETELLLLFDDTHGSHSMREYEEMKAHDVAWQLVEEWARDKERPLTEQAIKHLNEVILVRPFWKDAITPDGQTTKRQIKIGDYKQYPNSVRLANGEVFEYASPIDTPIFMRELVEWYNTERLHPVTMAAMLHYKFVRIHPFDDGNGRIARLLMNYVLIRNDLPPVIIKSNDKQAYLRALHLADTGSYEPFIDYIAEQLEWSLRISIKAAKGESIEDEDDVSKEIALFKKSLDKKNASKKTNSKEEINSILMFSGRKLFMRLNETLAQFNELFHQTEKRFNFSENEGNNYNIRARQGGFMLAINSEFPNSFIAWIEKNKHRNFSNFGIEFYWSGYRLSIPAFDVGINIAFTFDKFSYRVSRTTTFDELNNYIEVSYEKQLTEEQINFVVRRTVEDLMNQIKSNHSMENSPK